MGQVDSSTTNLRRRNRLRRRCLLVMAFGALALPCVLHADIRVALLPSVEFDRSGSPIVDFLEADLSVADDLTLLNRADIKRILEEKQLTLAVEGSTAGTRRTWGEILRADLLVLFELRESKDGRVADIVVVETKHGLRLGRELIVLDDEVAARVAALGRFVHRAAARARSGFKHVFAVPPFESTDLLYEFAHLQEAYARLVESALAELPGAVVVELPEARAIARELALSEGGAAVERSLPYYVHGRYRNDGRGEHRRVRVELELLLAEKTLQRRTATDLAAHEVAAFVQSAALGMASEIIGHSPGAPGNRSGEAGLLQARSNAFQILGEYEHAISLAEAALLLDPDRHRLHGRIVGQVASLLWDRKAREMPGARFEEPARAGREAREYLRYALLGLQHAASAVRLEKLDQALQVRLQGVWFCALHPVNFSYDWQADAWELRELMEEIATRQKKLIDTLLRQPQHHAILAHVTHRAGDLIAENRIWSTEQRIEIATGFLVAAARQDRWFRPARHLLEKTLDRLESKPGAPEELLRTLEATGDRRLELLTRCQRITAGPPQHASYEGALAEIDAICLEADPDVPPPSKAALTPTLSGGMIHGPNGDLTRRLMRLYGIDEPVAADATDTGDPLFQPIELQSNGRSVSFAQLSPVFWERCGDHCDAMASLRAVHFMRQPGVVEPMSNPTANQWEQISDLRWDGRYLWVADAHGDGRLVVLDPATSDAVAVLHAPQDLPPLSKSCRIEPLGPGRAIVVGQFRQRTWIAEVEVGADGTSDVRVLHEARRPVDRLNNPKLSQDVELAFAPGFTFTIRGEDGRPLVIIGRREAGGWAPRARDCLVIGLAPLVVDVERRDVRVMPARWSFGTGVAPAGDRVYLLTWKNLRQEAAFVRQVRVSRAPDFDPMPYIESIDKLYNSTQNPSSIVFDGRFLHSYGDYWTTVDVERRTVVVRKYDPAPTQRASSGFIALSAHYGLVLVGPEALWDVELPEPAR